MNEYSYTEKHMGTTVSLSFVCPNQEMADEIATKTFTTIKEYEQRFSRFLPGSELTTINQSGSGLVSPEFSNVLKRSLELADLTGSVFNPLVQVSTIGYEETYTKLSSSVKPLTDHSYSTDLNLIKFNNTTNELTLGQGQKLDFGGILKGYLAKLLADHIITTYPKCAGCIINIGGDIATRGTDEFHETFIFFLYNPITGEEIPVALKDTSLATSGTYSRHWQTDQGVMHHIVDSQSQKNPQQDIVATSIIAKDGALTEALAKLFLIKGSKEATEVVAPKKYQYQYLTISSKGDLESNIV